MKYYGKTTNDKDFVTKEYVDEVASGAAAEVTQSAPSTIALADNTMYYLTNVSSLAFTYPASGHWECLIELTTAASGTVSITLSAGSSYIGDAPTFGNGETWEISIRDGIVVAGQVSA